MKALRFERSIPKYAAARIAGALAPGKGARFGPLSLVNADDPILPGPQWRYVRPLLAGICGSDLSTVDGKSSRYFEPIVSFPFVPGHEVVGELDDGTRVVIEPVLACAARGITPLCRACSAGDKGRCGNLAHGHITPGLQTGYCESTGGGWSTLFVAHDDQVHAVPAALDDDQAVMIEPTACAVHGVLRAQVPKGALVVVIGAGTLGLLAVAALRHLSKPQTIIVGAKYPEQRENAMRLGADIVVEPGEVRRAVRRATKSYAVGDTMSDGADVVIDCVGDASSIAEALAITRPGGRIALVGMPGWENVDLTPLWQREIELVGAYAYGTEHVTKTGLPSKTASVRTFDLAMDLVAAADLGRLVSARYPLARYREAIDHAANAGRRGATKIVFDLTKERR